MQGRWETNPPRRGGTARMLVLLGAMGLTAGSGLGCEWNKGWLRSQSDGDLVDAATLKDLNAAAGGEDEHVDEGEAESRSVSKGFFKRKLPPGTLSSEAAEIEKDLGVYR